MKYWIIIDNAQRGPLTEEELAMTDGINDETPVWHSGLLNWTTIAQEEGLQEKLQTLRQQRHATEEPEQVTATGQPVPDTLPQLPCTGAAYQQPMPQPVAMPRIPEQQRKQPPTYLVWNIIATLACCMPTGIVGLVMSNKVSEAYSQGDMRRARQMSERAALWLIISIVLGLMSMPFQMLVLFM